MDHKTSLKLKCTGIIEIAKNRIQIYQIVVSRPNIVLILTNHTSMESLFIQLSGDVEILLKKDPYDWFCGPHILT